MVEAAVVALHSAATDDDTPWTIYRSNSSSNNAGAFSVGLADETKAPDGTPNVSLSLSAFSFSGTENNELFLWRSYSSNKLDDQGWAHHRCAERRPLERSRRR